MNKSKTKIERSVRAQAIKNTAVICDVSKEYVRAALLGTSKGGRTEEMLRCFNEEYAKLKPMMLS